MFFGEGEAGLLLFFAVLDGEAFAAFGGKEFTDDADGARSVTDMDDDVFVLGCDLDGGVFFTGGRAADQEG